MGLSKVGAILVGLLIVVTSLSLYFWSSVGTGRAEVDSRIATIRQSFSCEKCGHEFELTTGDVSKMRRSRGEITCLKCGEAGARKNLIPRKNARHTTTQKTPAPAEADGKAKERSEVVDSGAVQTPSDRKSKMVVPAAGG